MRNPETFEWMLNNPEYRAQLEAMLQQQVRVCKGRCSLWRMDEAGPLSLVMSPRLCGTRFTAKQESALW